MILIRHRCRLRPTEPGADDAEEQGERQMERERTRKRAAGNGPRQPGNRRPRGGAETNGAGRQRPAALIQPDELDRRIITMLRADGRRSNREIARTLGVPEATVRYRVRRLTEGGVLKITASVDPEHLGY